MTDITPYVQDIAKYSSSVNEDVVTALVKSLAPILGNRDAMNVACSDDAELDTVRTNFITKKCGVTDADKANAATAAACKAMSGDNSKNRVTFYYLVAEELGCLGKLA